MSRALQGSSQGPESDALKGCSFAGREPPTLYFLVNKGGKFLHLSAYLLHPFMCSISQVESEQCCVHCFGVFLFTDNIRAPHSLFLWLFLTNDKPEEQAEY